MSGPSLISAADASMAEIPIDPALLAEDAAAEERFEAEQEADESSEGENDEEAYDDKEDEVNEVVGEGEEDPLEAGPSRLRSDKDDAVFDRLAGFVSRPGAAPSGTTGDLGGRDFQREIVLADKDELPQPARRRHSKPRRVHKPSHEVTRLLGQANFHNLLAQTEEAIEIYLEVIRHDPYISAAWASLATCYDDIGDAEKARQMRFLGAHVDNDEETWRSLAYDFKQNGHQDQCVYCLRKALKHGTEDTELLWELGSIYVAQRQKSRASDVFKKLIKSDPAFVRDFDIMMEFHQVLIETNQRSLIVQVMRETFDWHIATFSSPDDHRPVGHNSMTIERVLQLVDEFLFLDDLDQALEIVRKGQRWLQGRRNQKQWDTFSDDREYDPPGTIRTTNDGKDSDESEGFAMDIQLRHKLALIRLRLGDDEEALIHINEILNLDVLQYHRLFLELGGALMKRELWEKALDCYASIQESDELLDTPEEVYHVGICHHNLKNLHEAQEALQWVVTSEPDHINARLRLANVLEDMGRKAEALELVSDIIRSRAHREKDSHAMNRSLFEEPTHLNKAEKAANKKLTKRVLEDQMRSQMQNLWQDVQDAEKGIDEGDIGALDRFIAAAGTMIENYRLNRGNFSKSRGVVRILKSKKHKRNDVDSQAQEMQDRLERMLGFEDDAPAEGGSNFITYRRTEFYGLNYEEWLTLMVKYCCVLMVKNEEDIAMDILEHVIWSGLFHNRRCEVALRLTIIACAMRLRSYEKITDNCKRLSQMHQFDPSPILLMQSALSTGGLKAFQAWGAAAVQAFISREMKTYASAIPLTVEHKGGEEIPPTSNAITTTKLHYNAPSNRWTHNRGSRFDGDTQDHNDEEHDQDDDNDNNENNHNDDEKKKPDLPKKASPYWYILHGQEMVTNKSYQSAFFYLFRAYELDQYNPLICLLISQAFFGRAMNRQSDNRNYQIAQGMAFLTRYRKLSPCNPVSQEQVEYNYGRSFHGIGVNHLAVNHYERVLDSIENRMKESDDPEAIRGSSLAFEAAHNLILLYATSGNQKLVKEKSKWLAI
ncbi:uncharacterized protein IL334_001693 [Kwoniella shivajii]|uniref:General transcription factor 3C polypeptide 3 (Transcription factor C subunit 4) n=1 Tax=Kwoniella shivajii TaxID=564305 RepID=A0ABZ1CU97_9TREE|nr:hypothetical protein IL334_001693 [Kwoniella shivajii]